jgi:hypothetical protein
MQKIKIKGTNEFLHEIEEPPRHHMLEAMLTQHMDIASPYLGLQYSWDPSRISQVLGGVC